MLGAMSTLFFIIIFCTTLSLSLSQPPLYPPQHSHACVPPFDGFPFCDTSLAVEDRVADLIQRLTLAEKVSMTYDLGSPVLRLGLPAYNWNQEGLHGLGGICFESNATSGIRCPTIFAAPNALASSFNVSLLNRIGDAITTEMRAYNNFGGHRSYQNRPVDLNVWLPNVNIARDGRWGRQIETYSEDPFMTGALGAAIVRGAQFGVDGSGDVGNGYLKAIVAVKHATAYQVETNRFALDETISQHDLADTYYPAWQSVIEDGGAVGFMCSYPSVNGVPMCGNSIFETTLMKETWNLGLKGGSYVQSDCGAIENIAKTFHYASNATFAAAVALNAGTDVDCGSAFPQQLALAIEMGLTTESTLDASLTRTYTLHFLAGRFDSPSKQPFMSIPFEAIGSQANLQLAKESAAQGLVLLRNDNMLLPLSPATAGVLAVIGPFGNDSSIAGNYFEDICPGSSGSLDCVPTLYESLLLDSPLSTFSQGCTVKGNDTQNIAAAVTACKIACVCILVPGTDGTVAGEGLDRVDTSLPGSQSTLALAILALRKPTIVILFNGGVLAIDALLSYDTSIIEAFNPGVVGGTPVADAMFGRTNRWGKLPVSWPPASYYTLLPIEEMDMVLGGGGAGRTYKYYNSTAVELQTNGSGKNLFELGFGLSYTNFSITGNCPNYSYNNKNDGTSSSHWHFNFSSAIDVYRTSPINCSVSVKNEGTREGDEVVTVFIVPSTVAVERGRAARLLSSSSIPRNDPLASKLLVAFARVTVLQNETVTIPFSIPIPSFSGVSDFGAREIYSGTYDIEFTRGHGTPLRIPIVIETLNGTPVHIRKDATW